eukprot:gene10049-18688_t
MSTFGGCCGIQHRASTTNFKRNPKATGPGVHDQFNVEACTEVSNQMHVEDDIDTSHELDEAENFNAHSPGNNSRISNGDIALEPLTSPISCSSGAQEESKGSPLQISIEEGLNSSAYVTGEHSSLSSQKRR